MSNLTLPPPREAPIDPVTGVFSRNWTIYFQQVFNRLGGSSSETIAEISAQIVAILASLSDSEVELAFTDVRHSTPLGDVLQFLCHTAEIAGLRKSILELKTEIASLTSDRASFAELRKQFNGLSVVMAMFNDTPFAIETGTFTPVLSFATPGNLSVSYSSQLGSWVRIGKLVHVSIIITTSAFTFTTASGNLKITGNPFTSEVSSRGVCEWAGITKASYTQIVSQLLGVSGTPTSTFNLGASGSGQAIANITAADMPTGGSVRVNISHTFLTTQ